jgi:pyrimidine operon attenuation protein/uracil phosphoribosyltransferase
MYRDKRSVMDKEEMSRALTRISHEILERNRKAEKLVVIGIKGGGVILARRLVDQIGKIENMDVPVGEMDITLYRDDSHHPADKPIIHKTEIPCSIDGKRVVLVDDVLYTGRTIRAALDSLMDMGRPNVVQLAVLVDRGHRELPIQADYVGKNIPTAGSEEVKVTLEEEEGEDKVILQELLPEG